MRRCLQIAKNGLGTSRPNPMVGALLVVDNKIIGEGFTSVYGGPHAEVNAINAVKNKADLQRATMYVTLEPCSHYGKTPPCSDLIVKNRIQRVVIGCTDDNPIVAGKGIERLRDSGCEVIIGILESECRRHHKRFFTFVNKNRPYIILKWAESKDGFIAPSEKIKKRPYWISNDYSRQLVHKWRADEQAILVGRTTVVEDNPSLTIRHWVGENPVRAVLDREAKLSLDYSIFKNEARTIIITSDTINPVNEKDDWTIYPHTNAQNSINNNISKTPINWGEGSIAHEICPVLYRNSINSVIIEGGQKTLQTFIDEELWDEARIFKGNVKLNGGTRAPKIEGKLLSTTNILEDKLEIYEPN